MEMSEIHQGMQNVKEIYSKTILTTLGHWLGRRTEFKKTEGKEAVTIKQSFLLRTTQKSVVKIKIRTRVLQNLSLTSKCT